MILVLRLIRRCFNPLPLKQEEETSLNLIRCGNSMFQSTSSQTRGRNKKIQIHPMRPQNVSIHFLSNKRKKHQRFKHRLKKGKVSIHFLSNKRKKHQRFKHRLKKGKVSIHFLSTRGRNDCIPVSSLNSPVSIHFLKQEEETLLRKESSGSHLVSIHFLSNKRKKRQFKTWECGVACVSIHFLSNKRKKHIIIY
ncbi:hypothetical protein LEP1GSC172_3739 [Leptospira noguchii]|uniref:Uncharacterized protein n=1 Tax=Leptospira noguchii TaxID=28182 RepID=M6VX02_9LEPT|nr:hypothetical protein LEP1GSC172_3739 [Leptospira noguchii]